jgi:EAL domain-containing protein (putative c-di-GMP-specific phosphodiesterase class I)
VNVSNRQFNRSDFEGFIARALHQSGLDPRHLQIELTESSVIQAEEEILRALSTIKTRGVRIAMDDFGTGYSSLGALYRLPIDSLKIDRSFVKDILTKPEDRTLISTIIAMAKNLNLTLTAEGVEDLSQLAFLHEKGCDQIQGYLVSPPLPAAAFEKFLREPIALSA